MSSGKLLLGVLAGVAAGALMGVLFAPAKGTVTRKRITRKGDDYADGLNDQFNDFLDNMRENFDSAKEKVVEFSKDGHSKDGHSKGEGAKAK